MTPPAGEAQTHEMGIDLTDVQALPQQAGESQTQEIGMGLPDVQDWTEAPAEMPESAPYPESLPDNPQESLQSFLSEISGDVPQDEALEEPLARAPEPPFYPGEFQGESLESQLATIASQEPGEPEISPFDPGPQLNVPSPRAP